MLHLLKLNLLFLFTLAISACYSRPNQIAATIPAINLLDLSGKTRTLEDFLGAPTILILWASWCPECVAELGTLNAATRHLATNDIQLIAVAIQDELDSVQSLPQVGQAIFPILVDSKGELLERYPTEGLPAAYLLSKKGDILPLIDPSDGLTKTPVTGLRSWQSKKGQNAILDSLLD